MVYSVVASVSVPPSTPALARIEVHNLTITPGTVEPGQTVVIRGEAVNTGWSSGEQAVAFSVSGVVQDTRVVVLAPGQRRELSYSLTPTAEGHYDVQLGDARGGFTVSRSKSVTALLVPMLGSVRTPLDLWSALLVVVTLLLILAFVLGRLRMQRLAPESAAIAAAVATRPRATKPTPVGGVAPARKPRVRKPRKLAVLGITGPTRRLKMPGPYVYAVKVVGGKPPYSVEWSGNTVIRTGANGQRVELFRDQTWDSGKGNWVFVRVKDSDGKYAQWLDDAGVAKTLFTYGVTYRNRVVTAPVQFPYNMPADG